MTHRLKSRKRKPTKDDVPEIIPGGCRPRMIRVMSFIVWLFGAQMLVGFEIILGLSQIPDLIQNIHIVPVQHDPDFKYLLPPCTDLFRGRTRPTPLASI